MIRRLAVLPFLVVPLVAIAAGCGSSSGSSTSGNDAYANSVCDAVAGWETTVKGIVTDFSGGISQAELQSKVTQVEDATKTLASQIKAVPPPDSAEGTAAKQQLDQLSTDATNTVDATKSAISSLGSSPSVAAIGATAKALLPQYQALATSAKSALTSIKDAGGDLASSFQNSDACQGLG
jgi:hypothetical protein